VLVDVPLALLNRRLTSTIFSLISDFKLDTDYHIVHVILSYNRNGRMPLSCILEIEVTARRQLD